MLNGTISASVDLYGLKTNVTVYYNSTAGVQLILVNIRYADQFAIASADLVYNVDCIDSIRTRGDAALVLHGIADGDLAAHCAVQLFSGCSADKEWALQCAFGGQSITNFYSIIIEVFRHQLSYDYATSPRWKSFISTFQICQ